MSRRFCAHRGLSGLTPENTMPSFAAAMALGADEIEFDVRLTRDGHMVVSHEFRLERISDRTGFTYDQTLADLLTLNVGRDLGWDVRFCLPEEVFEAFAGRMAFNIHVKEAGENGQTIRELVRLAEKYGNTDSIYFAASPEQLEWAQKIAPEIPRCANQAPVDTIHIREMARRYGCSRVQLCLGMFDQELIEQLHRDGLSCNLYFGDTPEDFERYFGMGVDTLLTNRMDRAKVWRG